MALQNEHLFDPGLGRDLAVDPVLSYDERWVTNADMVADLSLLGWFDGDVLDLTYGEGVFWKKFRPTSLTCNDLHPGKGDVSFDWSDPGSGVGAFRRWDVVVFDPPYKLQGTPSGVGSDDRYGVGVSRTVDEVVELHQRGCVTAQRLCVDGGLVLVKTQPQRACNRFWDLSRIVEDTFDDGWVLDSRCFMKHTPPPQRTQKTPRNNLSQLIGFRHVG